MEKDPNESYQHAAAKSVFVGWMREKDSIGDMYWVPNRDAPYYGVFEEYPINASFSTVWDENGFPDRWPDYEWMKENCKEDFKIADVAIQHKGMIAYIIEITHKNALSQDKINFYRNLPLKPEILEIPAHWILGQVSRPTKIPSEFFK